MMIVMKERATDAQIEAVVAQLLEMGYDVHRSGGSNRTVIGAVGQGNGDTQLLAIQDGVQEVLRITEPYKLASRTFKPDNTVVTIGDIRIGAEEVIVMAGPCSAESEEQVETTAAAVKRAGAKILRGGAFKPRSSPYSFQGLGEAGLRMLRGAADRHGLKLVSEVMDLSQIAMVERYARDIQDDWWERRVFTYGAVGPVVGTAALCAVIGLGWGLLAASIHAVTYVFVLSSSINGLCHHVGYKNFDNTATNLRLLALLTGGEGLHNNHHGYQRSPKFSFRRSEIDPAWPIIRFLVALKLARPYKTIEEIAV